MILLTYKYNKTCCKRVEYVFCIVGRFIDVEDDKYISIHKVELELRNKRLSS